MTPAFIVLEGPDGAGKSVQAARLAARLAETTPTLLTREPSEGPVGVLIREVLRGHAVVATEAMGRLFAADRCDHVVRGVAPALARGEHVVCDRYDLSNLVYRAAEAEGPFYVCTPCGWSGEPAETLPLEPPGPGRVMLPARCKECHAFLRLSESVMRRVTATRQLSEGILRPSLTVVLAVAPEVAAARRRTRGLAAEAYETDRTQARCCAAYACAHALCARGERLAFVDGAAAEETVAERVWAAVMTEIERGSGAGGTER